MTLLDPQGARDLDGSQSGQPAKRPEPAEAAAARAARRPRTRRSGSLLERAVCSRLEAISRGSLLLRTPSGPKEFGSESRGDGMAHGVADIHDERFWTALALRGSVGAGEAFAQGWWSSPEPVDVVRVFVANQKALDGMERGLARLSLPFLKAYHALRDNTRGGAARNISAHYDLSNAFFELFLDPTMTYSSALWETPGATLEAAQLAKIDRLCERLRLNADDHLLEIGTGWGGFALRAATKFGCRVTTTTISREQHAFATERIARAGLADRVDVRLEDYRDLRGRYTKAVSVEMIEAVGARHYPAYFESISNLLEPGGAFACQAITIHDKHFERAARSVDFIQRHIFPGSCIPSVAALTSAAAKSSDLRLVWMEDFGDHYARTLRTWRDELRARRDDARALGFDDTFLRLFDFYFAYCEGGFTERHIGIAHLVFAGEGRGFVPPLAKELQRTGPYRAGSPAPSSHALPANGAGSLSGRTLR